MSDRIEEIEDGERTVRVRVLEFDPAHPTDDLIYGHTNPWVEVDGKPVDWMEYVKEHPMEPRYEQLEGDEEPGLCTCGNSPVAGALEAMDYPEGIQRCDNCERFPGDLEAAWALAQLVGGKVFYYADLA